MNIAMVSEHASPLAVIGGADAGGQNVHVAELSAALVRAGHRVSVYTRRDRDRAPARQAMPSGVVVELLDAGPAAFVPKDDLWPHMGAFAQRLFRRLAAEPPDVVHAHFWMSGSAALAAAQPLGIPVVQTFHALGSEKARMQGVADTSPAVRIAEETRIVRSVDRIVATSSSEVFELRRLGADPRRLKIVPCGVDVLAFDEAATSWRRERARAHRIVTLSRLVERKGVDDVISALAAVPDTELIVAGGPAESGLDRDPDARRLAAHAAACGVAERVVFLGCVARHAIPSLLRSADVVVTAPWYEPFGIVPLEAMAVARPVVATSVGGLLDTVLDGFTGIHVAPRQPHAIASALRALLGDDAKRLRLGLAGRERVQQRFTWERVARETEIAYRGLVRVPSDEAAFTA